MRRAKHYIARKDEFENALTSCGTLRVYAVYDDGETLLTTLSGYLKTVTLVDGAIEFQTDQMKGDRTATLYLI